LNLDGRDDVYVEHSYAPSNPRFIYWGTESGLDVDQRTQVEGNIYPSAW
jgi:hypothetical protein